MGGGNFVVPAQCVTDFLSNRLSGTKILLGGKDTEYILFFLLINFIICSSYNSPTIKL